MSQRATPNGSLFDSWISSIDGMAIGANRASFCGNENKLKIIGSLGPKRPKVNSPKSETIYPALEKGKRISDVSCKLSSEQTLMPISCLFLSFY